MEPLLKFWYGMRESLPPFSDEVDAAIDNPNTIKFVVDGEAFKAVRRGALETIDASDTINRVKAAQAPIPESNWNPVWVEYQKMHLGFADAREAALIQLGNDFTRVFAILAIPELSFAGIAAVFDAYPNEYHWRYLNPALLEEAVIAEEIFDNVLHIFSAMHHQRLVAIGEDTERRLQQQVYTRLDAPHAPV